MGTPPAEAAGEPPAAPAEPGDKAGGEAGSAPRSREASQQPQQGSREASQQPQAGAAAAAQQPASSSQLAGGSKLSAGSGGSLKRLRGSGAKGGEESKVVVYGKEVVGRQVGVWSAKAADWPKAVVAQFNGAADQHLLRYLERPAGSIKHHEEWVCLARTRFQWLAAPPPQAKPNPSWDGAPRGDDAVGYKVKVFWPGMSKWYVGKIMSFDPKTKLHSVKYRDGDTAELELRHEAVQYIEKEGTPRVRPDVKGGRPVERRQGAKEPQAGAKGGSSGTPGSAKKAAAGGSAAAANGKGGPKRQREESVEPVDSWDRKLKAARSNSTQDTASNAGRAAGGGGGGGGGGGAVAAPEAPAAGGGTGMAPPTASPPKDAVAGSLQHEVSAAMGDSEEGHGFSGMGTFEDELPSSSGGGEDDDFGSEVFISDGEMGAEEEEEDSDFEVESYRRGRRGGAISARTARSTGTRSQRRGGGGGGVRSVGTRRDRRTVGSGRRGRPSQSAGGVRSASGTPRFARRDSVPALRGGAAAVVAARKVLRADEETIKAAGAGIVGARVAVCRHDDDVFAKGRLVQFDSYHKRHKVCYDDGEEEWVSLAREPFRWLTPRARSAGCTPDFRTLMQQLGAEDCGAPGVATRRAAATGGGQAVPGEGVAPPTADGCLGWQVSLLFDGDGQWYRGEIVGYDPRRGKALLLYDDGEDEWIALEGEELTWHCQLAGPSGIYPGLGRGLEPPVGRSAVGWRVCVYWPADQAFYAGEVVGYDAASGRHEVAYDDGEEGGLDLRLDKVKWVLPPGAAVDREKLDAGEGHHRVHHRRRAGDDSDPDFEVLEYRPRAQPRRPFALSPAPTPLAGVAAAAGRHWDAAETMEASLLDGGAGQPLRHINLRPVRHPGGAADPAAAGLGPPLVVRQLTRVTGLANLGGGGEGSVPLPMPITVRIYLSSSSGSAASADTAVAADPPADAAAEQGGEVARLQARLAALERMSRRVAKAQQTIVKGVPTPMPSRSQAAAEGDAARLVRPGSAAGAGAGTGTAPVTSPTAAQRAAALLASSHASGLHRLARGSTSFSPFHQKRPHPADSEGSSSSGSSSEEEGEEGDTGADSADARRRGGLAHAPSDGPDGMPLSPRLNGAKIKPLTEGEEGGEGSAASDAMLTAPPSALGAQSPALFSALRSAPAIPPMPDGLGGSAVVLPGGAVGGDHGLLGGGPGLPHSASMDLILPLPLHPPPLEGLPQPDSMGNLMALGGGSAPGSRNTSAMLGVGHSELLALGQPHDDALADTGAGGKRAAAAAVDLLGEPLADAAPGMDLDALPGTDEAP
ncbi:Histone-lysine N-methyltransferase ATX2 [Chlorella sorokiniana]|uniref:Histone-lysine N-methyltransferase ATX2 n=1 Tax=Chlorella sorokiniana TaxID=3076 RepID=A0A2P6U196_CHLSO|nr:Histone-lysine N-methyltransferase ATX2 [Chlorella sorokiniana]|eukprot:PRW60087.1 Histone-lysine N-methyltransferase ATX2 [Chlorella sorokiniana]